MDWQLMLLVILGTLVFLMVTGMPVAFCFMLVNVIGAFLFWGGEVGLVQLTLSFFASGTTFALLPLPLFILMGEVMFHSGIAPRMINALDKWLGRLPGRLGLLAVGGGTLFATLSGASMASVAMLGSVLVPEMERRGYKKPISMGPILGSGGLAVMIPPSALAVLLGAIGEISIGKILIAIIIPGLLMSLFYVIYIIVRCQLQPSVAPAYEITHTPLSDKLMGTVRYILPLGTIIFLVTGIIFLGVATPTEAAAAGTLGSFILAAAYRKLNWQVIKKALSGATYITGMMFMIIVGAKAFAQILAFTGVSNGLLEFTVGLSVSPLFTIIAIQIVVLFLGCFMDPVAIMMITLPIFVPVIHALGFDPVWFGVVMLLNLEMALITPPYGISLFVMKGVAPPDTTMGDIYKASLPFVGCNLIIMTLLISFPALVLWLPGVMR